MAKRKKKLPLSKDLFHSTNTYGHICARYSIGCLGYSNVIDKVQNN